MSHDPNWMDGKRPCSECSFVIPHEEANSNGGMCDQCMASHIPTPEYDQYNPHHYWSIEDWREEVADGTTYCGYGDWVQALIVEKSDELTRLEERFEEFPENELSEDICELRRMLDPNADDE